MISVGASHAYIWVTLSSSQNGLLDYGQDYSSDCLMKYSRSTSGTSIKMVCEMSPQKLHAVSLSCVQAPPRPQSVGHGFDFRYKLLILTQIKKADKLYKYGQCRFQIQSFHPNT
jgi:hypothetical protein